MSATKKVITPLSKLIPLSWMKHLSNQHFIHAFYHSISDTILPHIQNLYPVKNSQQFEADLDFLLKHFQPISMDTFLLNKHNPSKLKDKFVLSFDDGLREVKEVIAPILQRKGIPATCFLNSAFVDNKDLFYRYKASLIIHQLNTQKELLSNPQLVIFFKEQNWNTANYKQHLLSVAYNQRDLMDKLANSIGVDFNAYLHEIQPYLNSEEIIALQQQEFTFGAHSIDHPLYYKIPLDNQIHQTQKSLEFVQDTFNEPRIFAFPFTDYGVKHIFFENLKADATFGTAGLKKEKRSNHFQRIALEVGSQSAKDIIKSEYLYYLLKSPLKKNTIIRD